jgi:hypothetical protein
VNGRIPESNLDLKPWIDAAGVGADIVAVAFQEIVPLNAQNVVIGKQYHTSGAICCQARGCCEASNINAPVHRICTIHFGLCLKPGRQNPCKTLPLSAKSCKIALNNHNMICMEIGLKRQNNVCRLDQIPLD